MARRKRCARLLSNLTHIVTPEPGNEIPASLDAFRGWLGETLFPSARDANSRRALPRGIEAAEVMLLGRHADA